MHAWISLMLRRWRVDELLHYALEILKLFLLPGFLLTEVLELKAIEDVFVVGVEVEGSWADIVCVLDYIFKGFPDNFLRDITQVGELVIGVDELL